MRVFRGFHHPGIAEACALTIGNFDGVHRGHQAILQRVRAEADARGSAAVVLTFDPHPISVLRPDAAPVAVMTLRDRLDALGDCGVDLVLVQRFTAAFARIDPAEFVRRYLVDGLDVDLVLVGDDLAYGRARGGNVGTLREAGLEAGFGVEVVAPVDVDGVVARSSAVRRLVADGDVAAAARLLGRPHRVRGRVEHGAGRGKGLGFATANLAPETPLVPGHGVYATVACVGRRRLDSVTSVGSTPTFGGTATVIEAHLLADPGDLYGKPMVLEFLEKIRDQRKFDSPAELVERIALDVAKAREVLEARRRA